MKIMVYSHDAFGLGNIRRMMAICEYLLDVIPNLSILLVSGSPMLQSFRLPPGFDYIKLPCLSRDLSGQLTSKYLGMDVETTVKLRSDLILGAARNFQPDVLLVDKKPYGLRQELTTTLRYLKCTQPRTKFVLLLRDVLDSPEKTMKEWREYHYFDVLDLLYERILVVGMADIFDLRQEYQFPIDVANKVEFCGYLQKQPGQLSPLQVRQKLGITDDLPLVLVTPGGGEDGWQLIINYLHSIAIAGEDRPWHNLIITGSEMPNELRQQLVDQAQSLARTNILEFTDDAMSYLNAANLIVCMGGYNTITEILSLHKPAIVIPRIHPSHEQLIRIERMSQKGWLTSIHPDRLTPEILLHSIRNHLQFPPAFNYSTIDFQGLPQVARSLAEILSPLRCPDQNFINIPT